MKVLITDQHRMSLFYSARLWFTIIYTEPIDIDILIFQLCTEIKLCDPQATIDVDETLIMANTRRLSVDIQVI